jgi:hypothetical protein
MLTYNLMILLVHNAPGCSALGTESACNVGFLEVHAHDTVSYSSEVSVRVVSTDSQVNAKGIHCTNTEDKSLANACRIYEMLSSPCNPSAVARDACLSVTPVLRQYFHMLLLTSSLTKKCRRRFSALAGH